MLKQSVIIIDDEAYARKRLKQLLQTHAEIEILGEAANGAEGLQLIKEMQPDLIFLDISMPVMTGFEMLQKLHKSPKIIFTTAHDEYALQAFEQNSVDYLLKPFSAERLEKALQKAERLSFDFDPEKLHSIFSKVQPQKKSFSITVTVGDRMIIVPHNDIVYIQSEDKCSVINDINGKQYLTYLSLTKLMEKLPSGFLQVHRAYIININHIYEIRKSFKGQLSFVMKDPSKTKISTGKTYVKSVKEELAII